MFRSNYFIQINLIKLLLTLSYFVNLYIGCSATHRINKINWADKPVDAANLMKICWKIIIEFTQN